MDPRCPPSGACGVTLKGVRPTSAQRPPWLALREWLDAQGGMAGVVEGLRGPRSGAAHELEEARELLAYWERRARRLPPWALVRRREAREMVARWRLRVADAERARYGPGVLGAVSQYALERRMPTGVAHRGRRAVRLTAYAAAVTTMTLLLVLVAAVAMVADAVLHAL